MAPPGPRHAHAVSRSPHRVLTVAGNVVTVTSIAIPSSDSEPALQENVGAQTRPAVLALVVPPPPASTATQLASAARGPSAASAGDMSHVGAASAGMHCVVQGTQVDHLPIGTDVSEVHVVLRHLRLPVTLLEPGVGPDELRDAHSEDVRSDMIVGVDAVAIAVAHRHAAATIIKQHTNSASARQPRIVPRSTMQGAGGRRRRPLAQAGGGSSGVVATMLSTGIRSPPIPDPARVPPNSPSVCSHVDVSTTGRVVYGEGEAVPGEVRAAGPLVTAQGRDGASIVQVAATQGTLPTNINPTAASTSIGVAGCGHGRAAGRTASPSLVAVPSV